MSFNEYYQYYLSLHQNKWCRRLHILGQIATIAYVIFCFHLPWMFWPLLVFTPFIVYLFAWTGHFVFEKNKPAAFKNPLWAKACDWRMLWDTVTGKIPL